MTVVAHHYSKDLLVVRMYANMKSTRMVEESHVSFANTDVLLKKLKLFFPADFEQPRSMMPIEIFPDNSKAPSFPDVARGGPRKPRRRKNRASSPSNTSSARSSSSRSRASFATAYDAFSESQRGFRVA
jgi:hypothetical protein